MPERSWTLWDRQLLAVGRANGRSYTEMARVFRVSRNAVAGTISRMRYPQPHCAVSLRGSADPAILVHQITTKVDGDMLARIDALRRKGQSRASVMRDLLEWGLEASEL